MSPQSSVAFHPAVLIVVLRWYASNKLIFRRHASKNPGGLGAEPPRSMGSNSKTFRFSNRLACLSPRRSLSPSQSPGGEGGPSGVRFSVGWVKRALPRNPPSRMGNCLTPFLIFARAPLPLRPWTFASLPSILPSARDLFARSTTQRALRAVLPRPSSPPTAAISPGKRASPQSMVRFPRTLSTP